MGKLERRTQILLDEDRYRRLQREARKRGSSLGALVREAIDQRYPPELPDRAAAIDALLSLPPLFPAMEPDELKREINAMWEKHLGEPGGGDTGK